MAKMTGEGSGAEDKDQLNYHVVLIGSSPPVQYALSKADCQCRKYASLRHCLSRAEKSRSLGTHQPRKRDVRRESEPIHSPRTSQTFLETSCTRMVTQSDSQSSLMTLLRRTSSKAWRPCCEAHLPLKSACILPTPSQPPSAQLAVWTAKTCGKPSKRYRSASRSISPISPARLQRMRKCLPLSGRLVKTKLRSLLASGSRSLDDATTAQASRSTSVRTTSMALSSDTSQVFDKRRLRIQASAS